MLVQVGHLKDGSVYQFYIPGQVHEQGFVADIGLENVVEQYP